jgi:F-type H+-transporting ATPase subunit gamma
MAGAKEIRTKIASVQNTQKITRAMEMVAASKMRKAQQRMVEARPYAEKIRNVLEHVRSANLEYVHPHLCEREIKRVGYLIVTSDRGLCGGLNANLFRMLVQQIDQWRAQDIEMDFCAIGSKGTAWLRRFGANMVGQVTQLGDTPGVDQLVGPLKIMLDAYEEGRLDRIFFVYNKFVNSMTQQAVVEQLLPREADAGEQMSHHWDYIYEPESNEVLDALMLRYVESLVYQGVVENIASEMAARMVAMKAATDNAGELISDLQLAYNKARQAAITQELSEIVSGAAAV